MPWESEIDLEDILGPLLAGIGAFPFIPDRLGQYLKDTQKIRGLSGSQVPLFHGTSSKKFMGSPDLNPESEVVGPDEISSLYYALNPRMSEDFSQSLFDKPSRLDDPRIIEDIVDMENIGYAPWGWGDIEGGRSKEKIFPEMRAEGRSGVILDPYGYEKTILPENMGLEGGQRIDWKKFHNLFRDEYTFPQVALWDPDIKRQLGGIHRPEHLEFDEEVQNLLEEYMQSHFSDNRRYIESMLDEIPIERKHGTSNINRLINMYKDPQYDFDDPRWYTGE